MNITEHFINSRYESNYFLNHPSEQSSIEIVFQYGFSQEKPTLTIVMPIHNQEAIIRRILQALVSHITDANYEIILIIDCCSDDTEMRIMQWLNEEAEINELITNILVLKSHFPLFETAADNIGFLCASGRYILEIQADMEMTEIGFNNRLLRPFLHDPNIIGISGRCCHNLTDGEGVGKLGTNILKSVKDLNIDRNYYYIAHSCNRGPLMLDKEKLIDLKYLDEVHYFLDDSDHDLFARAFLQKGWTCGYVPIDFTTSLENGSTRKERDELNTQAFQYKKYTCISSNGFLAKNISKLPKQWIIKKPL